MHGKLRRHRLGKLQATGMIAGRRTADSEARAAGDRRPGGGAALSLGHKQRLELGKGTSHPAVERVHKDVELIDGRLARPSNLVAILPQ